VRDFGVRAIEATDTAALRCDLLVLAVKPQQMREVCAGLAPHLDTQTVLSIAAGLRAGDLSRWLGGHARIVRAMPNTPALIGQGVSGLYADASVSDAERTRAEQVLAAVGTTVWVADERLIDAVTALSGSGPAYVFHFIEAMVRGGEALGLSADQAHRLAIATFTGASQGPAFGMGPENTVGIACSFAGFRNPNGFDARCSVSGVSAFGGFVTAPNSLGLVCDGTCGNQGAACTGSCGEVVNNTFSAGSGTQMNHVLLRNSSPSLRANRLGVGGNGITCGNNAAVVGLTLQGSAASVINNLIVGGPCLTSVGVSNQLALRSDGTTPSANFHSNTIVSRTSGGGSPSLNSIGVQLLAPQGSAAALVGSTWRNNIVYAGPAQGSSSVAVAFRETTPGADPATLANNLFFTDSPSLNPPLYIDEGATPLVTTAAINGLMGASGNVAGDPNFVNAGNGNYAPASPSPARAAGTTTGAPAVDLNGASRPNPVGSNPDIGCIEVN